MMKNLQILFLIVLFLFPAASIAQQYKISGRIYDQQSNAPLSSANIVVKETQKGAISAEDGYFELFVVENKPVAIAIT